MPKQASARKTAMVSAGGRGARRRQDTRARLVRAAQEVMARKGVGATSIQEITDTADVGFGSFYNHFSSKEAIADAVMEEAIESFGNAADRIAETIDDPAEVLAASIRHAIVRAAADEAWGWFLVRTGLTRADGLQHSLGRRLARDIRAGIDARRFKVADATLAIVAVAGVVLSIIASRLRGVVGKDAPEGTASIVLKLLNVPEREAKQIAQRPLPPIVPDERQPSSTRRDHTTVTRKRRA